MYVTPVRKNSKKEASVMRSLPGVQDAGTKMLRLHI